MYRGTKETIDVSCCDRMLKMAANKRRVSQRKNNNFWWKKKYIQGM